ncbi:MAG: outer membrane beta-barrel protein [Ferruginibacter sp.]
MIRKFFGTAIIAFVTIPTLFAQDSTKSLTISGSVDGYYRHNFGAGNGYTSFTKSQSSFALGMASVRADASALSGRVTAVADLGFGPRAEEFSYYEYASKSTLSSVKQLYATLNVSKDVKFTMGKWATHVGYEVLDAPLNRNYSMSYMFTNGPFSHTGLKMDVTAGPVGFMIGVANFIDETNSTTGVKTLIGQFSGGSKDGKFKGYLNYAGFFGSKLGANPLALESLNQLDLVITQSVTSMFNIGFNATLQNRKQIKTSTSPSGTWYGAALYLNVDPSASVGLTLRSEYISDSKIIYYGTKNIFANTLSLNCKVGPFTLIPEFRFENAQSAVFTKNDGTASKSTSTLLLATVYKF